MDLLNHGGLAAHGSLGLGSAAWQSLSGDDGEDNQSIMFVTSKRVPAGDQVGAEAGGGTGRQAVTGGDDGEDNQSIMFVTSKRVPAGDQVGAEAEVCRQVLEG